MFKSSIFLAVAALTLALWGCNKQSSNPLGGERPATNATAEHDHSNHPHSDSADASSNSEIKAELAKLTGEDRAMAEKQQICPVSGEALGAMGAPIKVDVNGKPVFICCAGCKKELLAKPDEYLAKLQK